MNNREARAALREWGAATAQIAFKKQRLEQVAELAEAAMLLDKYDAAGGGRSTHSALLREEIDLLGREAEHYLRQKRQMDEFINSLPLLHQRLLGLRYIQRHNWTYIARCLNYSEASVRRFESEILHRLQSWK
ncbi:MAG: hypothetical protein PHN35_06875 [Clostridia bacterium]|nr:hypothetical protein [Clostridia bacterium]